ncbi:MAG: TonB-dependent receptor [Porticoccaceae bacterium]|nr:MAG: TonB-dependent receptor [Porticoccaceae bacterium]
MARTDWRKGIRRSSWRGWAAWLATAAATATAQEVEFQIPRLDAVEALIRFAEQADRTLVFPWERVRGRRAGPLAGRYTAEEGLRRLLEGTPLRAHCDAAGTCTIELDEFQNRPPEGEMKRRPTLFGALAGFFAGAGIAAPLDDGAARGPIEEIVVTAQRRSERLLEVPMSITALSGQALVDAAITSTGDLGLVTPGLTTVSNGLAFTPAVRGISSSGTSPGDETNVAVYLDDVYLGAPLAGLFELKDIERVEVLKGPQGTLFGRNATGGAIRVVTRAPAFEPGLEVSADYGFEYDLVKLGTYATGPLGEQLAGSLSLYYAADDGYVEGKSPQLAGDHFARTDDQGIRGKLLFDPGGRFRATLAADWSERDDDRLFILIPRHRRSAYENRPGVILPAPFEYAASTRPIFSVENWGISLTAEWQLPRLGELKSITAYREVDGLYQTDTDRTNLSVASLRLRQTQDTLSQEFILSGSADEALSWLAGLYYYDSDAAAPFFNSYSGDAPHGPLAFQFHSQVDTRSLAGFGELTYSPAERLHLTLGARYTDEQKDYRYRDFLGAAADEGEGWSSTTWRAVARYDLGEAANVYLSYSTGFKSGVYNAYGLPTTGPVDPEELEAWELGAKGQLGTLTFTAAAFRYDYSDIQVQGQSFLPDGTWVVSLTNAAEAEIEGYELTLAGPLTDSLSFHLGYAGLPKAEYDRFPTAQVFLFNPATGGTDVVVPYDASGSRIIRAPKHQGTASLVHETAAFGGTLRASLTYAYNDGFYWQPGNLTPEGSFQVLNARIAWSDESGRYTVALWGENLNDATYSLYTPTTAAGISDAYAQPREVGIGISARF